MIAALFDRDAGEALELARPGMRFGVRPERTDSPPEARLENLLRGLASCRAPRSADGERLTERVREAVASLARCDELGRRRRRRAALDALSEGTPGTLEPTVEIFAQALLDCRALYGVVLHDAQLQAARVMLSGALVEMRTGEGKTFGVALTAIAAAAAGAPVHVVTANDYLAERDAETLRPLYRRFSLTVASVTERSTPEERRLAYRADIVHVTARQLVFDYLHDAREARTPPPGGLGEGLIGLTRGRRAVTRLRGLCFAVIDEADDVLVDEARTPFVLSAPGGDVRATRARAAVAISLARTLHVDVDFRVDPHGRGVELSEGGAASLSARTERLRGEWRLARYREELVRQALAALHLYRRDRDYLVRDGRVVLIDAASGRAQPDRRLRHGLHSMLELKERCEPRADSVTLAALGFQRFFARYHHLCGTSGTLAEVRGELREVYRLPVTRMATHRPCLLRRLPDTVVADREAQLERLVARVRECRAAGRPVLVGTRRLALSEQVAERLAREGLAPRLLNARQDAAEAALIASAGAGGTVTIATNMAGRGADIPLDARAREAGGLHVVCLELNDAARVDRQLFGRAARQGDPGSCERLLCLEDDALEGALPRAPLAAVRRAAHDGARWAPWLGAALVALARWRTTRRHRRERIAFFYRTEDTLRQLAVAGDQECP